ncbi:MAG: VOC family protein [Gammaproteobacteria bacterium]
MNHQTRVFGSFSVDDVARAKAFYGGTLGLDADDDEMGGLELRFAGDNRFYLYPKHDHTPATFTVLNFKVGDLRAEMKSLVAKGVHFERYEHGDVKTDADGVMHHDGMQIAWFKDPAGNFLSLIQERGS